MNDLSNLFKFGDSPVRVLKDSDGEPWFLASDIAAALDYSDTSAMTRTLDDCEKGVQSMQTLGGIQKVAVINESGLYSAIFRSRKPEAKSFKLWVTSEVLPAIRKTGSYNSVAVPTPPPPPQPLLLMPPIEEAARAASAISDCLRLEGTERASMLASTIKLKAPEYLPLLPAYATNAPRTQDGKLLGGEGNSKAAFAASPLLKKFNSQLSIHAFNKLAEASGFLETIERPSTKHEGLAKTFKSVTGKGLEYGYNLSHENSKGSTHPVWFQHKFEELLETLTK